MGKVHSKIKPSNSRSVSFMSSPNPNTTPLPPSPRGANRLRWGVSPVRRMMRRRMLLPRVRSIRTRKKCPRLRLQLHTLFLHQTQLFQQILRMRLSRPCRPLWLPSCRRIIFWHIGRKSCRAILVTAVRHLIRWFIIHRISISFLTGALPSIVIRWKSPIMKCAAFLNGSTAKATRMTRLP